MDNSGKLTGSPTAQLQAFAQSVYKMIKNRYFDDLTSPDGQQFLSEVVDWANEFIDELETEVDSDGDPLDWIWVRQAAQQIGTAGVGANTIFWDSSKFNNLCSSTDRFVQILDKVTNQVLSNWTVVSPDELSNDPNRNTLDMCTVVSGNVLFSRPFSKAEDGGIIIGDVTLYIPRIQIAKNNQGQLVATNVDVFKTVKPLTLLKLGTVKNAILPDIVMGNLQPSYVQKFNDLLQNAINRSQASAVSPTADYDDFTSIQGVGI